MKLRVVALGHRMPRWIDEGFAEYAKRLPRGWPLELVELKPVPRERRGSLLRALAREAAQIDAACGGYRMIALDERGFAWSTREFAARLRRAEARGDDIAFVIGSADGLDAGIKARAADVVSFSAMTLPHGLVRVLLAEQIYRAASLAAGHPYHRD